MAGSIRLFLSMQGLAQEQMADAMDFERGRNASAAVADFDRLVRARGLDGVGFDVLESCVGGHSQISFLFSAGARRRVRM